MFHERRVFTLHCALLEDGYPSTASTFLTIHQSGVKVKPACLQVMFSYTVINIHPNATTTQSTDQDVGHDATTGLAKLLAQIVRHDAGIVSIAATEDDAVIVLSCAELDWADLICDLR